MDNKLNETQEELLKQLFLPRFLFYKEGIRRGYTITLHRRISKLSKKKKIDMIVTNLQTKAFVCAWDPTHISL